MTVNRKQVAKYAGVSEATVSYVVNNGPRPVAPETRARVLEAIRVLGYTPSDVARSLASRRTSTIGVIVPDTANPFYGELARLVETLCYERKYAVILANSNLDGVRERAAIEVMIAKRVDGLIVVPTDSFRATAMTMTFPMPLILMDSVIPNQTCVVIDDYAGGNMVIQHLLTLGHERIGVITVPHSERFRAVRDALQGIGNYDANLVVEIEQSDIARGQEAAKTLLAMPNPPTAIVAHNDWVALGVYSAIYQFDKRIPNDLSVVGYDDIAESGYLTPPLTTIQFPKREMAEQAVNRLLTAIGDEQPLTPEVITLSCALITRTSTRAYEPS